MKLGKVVRYNGGRYDLKYTDWYTDGQKAQRVPINRLQVGESFRLLNKHGKPYGQRWTVTKEYSDAEVAKYSPYCLPYYVQFVDKNGIPHHVGLKNPTVKPCHGISLIIEAKLKESSFSLLD